jgi:hypothetical protein
MTSRSVTRSATTPPAASRRVGAGGRLLLGAAAWLLGAPPGHAYSVLSHEALVDAAWDSSVRPRLRERFPDASPEQLQRARAYAYGGCVIQDMGYYPYGNRLFTDLTHYVRTGAFVSALVAEAADLNEYAFALGAAAHYAGDGNGHSMGTNRAVPLSYPGLQRRYGDVVAYAEDPMAHVSPPRWRTTARCWTRWARPGRSCRTSTSTSALRPAPATRTSPTRPMPRSCSCSHRRASPTSRPP